MLSKLREILIGGDTGKREMGIAVFLAYCFAWVFSPNDREILAGMLIPVLMFLAAVYGLEWHGKQSRWRADNHVEYHSEE